MSSVRPRERESDDDVIVIDSDDETDLVRQDRSSAALFCLVFEVLVLSPVRVPLQVSTSRRQTTGALPKAGA